MENTVAGFRRAVAEGFQYLELDVRATADGVPVVHHDAILDRTTDAAGRIDSMPLAAVIAARVGGREPVPTLEQVLVELPDSRLTIELKDDRVVEPAMRLLEATGAFPRVCLGSYVEGRLQRVREVAGDRALTSMARRSAIALRARAWTRRMPVVLPMRGRLAQLPRRYGRITVIDPALLRAARRAGLEVHVWTVDLPDEMDELLDLGVDGLLSDRPDLLRDVLRRRGQWSGARPTV
ncbi:MAG: glycerophosphodiester phosphodiesterase family protein [Pseudonocardia sp.]